MLPYANTLIRKVAVTFTQNLFSGCVFHITRSRRVRISLWKLFIIMAVWLLSFLFFSVCHHADIAASWRNCSNHLRCSLHEHRKFNRFIGLLLGLFHFLRYNFGHPKLKFHPIRRPLPYLFFVRQIRPTPADREGKYNCLE